jgi:hypothetical protein
LLALGIEGKRELWRALLAVVQEIPACVRWIWPDSINAAEDQRASKPVASSLRETPLCLQNLMADFTYSDAALLF